MEYKEISGKISFWGRIFRFFDLIFHLIMIGLAVYFVLDPVTNKTTHSLTYTLLGLGIIWFCGGVFFGIFKYFTKPKKYLIKKENK
ncbi:hypothetical protein [Candidatus Pelagibacter sp.]|uniref:hypothetical protein n=1 Tax=Candidatus Pelagibacter sp. TaxID=2024849 RepID=UPI003F8678FD